MSKEFFPRVREAREALQTRALELYEKYEALIDKAIDKGELEVAGEHLRWLLDHMPRDSDGKGVIDSSAAKVKEVQGHTGPTIQIGIALTPTPQVKALPPETIDAEVVKTDESK